MNHFLRYLKNYKKDAIMAPAFKMLEAIFELFVPLVVARLIDEGINGSDRNLILKMGGLLLGLALVGYAAAITAQYFAAATSSLLGKNLRSELFIKINSLSYENLDRIGVSTLITRMTSDINQIQTGINMLLRLFLRSPFIIFGAVIMAFTVDTKAAVVFCIVLPVLAAVVFFIVFKTVPMYEDVQNHLDKVTLLTRENMTGARVIRAFNRESKTEEEFHGAILSLKKVQMKVGAFSAIMNPVTYVIVNLGIAVLLYYGAVRINIGELTQGQVVALINYMSQILIELVKLANLIITTTKGFAAANRVDEILAMTPAQVYRNVTKTNKNKGIRGYVSFEDVSFRFPDSSEDAISNITFDANPGEIVGIIGGTGSGKSSLISLIPRFYDVESGKVIIDGIDVKEYSKKDLMDKIGIVPEKSELFSGTIADNIRLGREDASNEDIENALKMAEAWDFTMKAGGIEYKIDQKARNLSGGQKQRLAIARALVKKPEILILDDSFSALDFATDAKLRKNLRKLINSTVFIVSQRASTIKSADKIIVLKDGKAAGIGKHDELIKNSDIYREICESQNLIEADEEKQNEK